MKITVRNVRKEKIEETIFRDEYALNSESVSWGLREGSRQRSNSQRDDDLLKSLWDIYLTDETVFAVVQSISMLTLGERYELEGIDKNSQEYLDLTRAFDRAWNSFYQIVRDTLVFGNGYGKIIKNRAGNFYNVEVIHPLEITKTMKAGETIYTWQNKVYTEDDIFENVFFQRSDSLYGIPLLGPAKNAIERKRTLEHNIEVAIQRHMPRFHVVLHPDKMQRYPSDEERRRIGREFRALSSDSEFVSTDLIDIKVIDAKSTIPQLEDYIMFTLNSILIGMNVPAEIVGAITRSGTYASSKVKVNTFLSFVLPYYQNMLQFRINSTILKDSKAKIKILRPEKLALPYSK